MATDVTLPELGENIEAGDVAAVLVNPGDRVEKDAPLLELETDKAVVEVPAPEAGVVTAVLVKAGDTISVGDTIASLEPDGAGAAAVPEPGVAPAAQPAAADAPSAAHAVPAAAPSAAGGGARTGGGRLARRGLRSNRLPLRVNRSRCPSTGQAGTAVGARAGRCARAASRTGTHHGARRRACAGGGAAGSCHPRGAPPGARDRRRHHRRHRHRGGRPHPARRRQGHRQAPAAGARSAPPRTSAGAPLPDFAQWGPVEEQAMNAVRRVTASPPERGVADHPGGHPAGQGRHHRPGAAAQALRAARRGGRRQADRDRHPGEGGGHRPEGVSAVQRQHRHGALHGDLQALLPRRHRRRHRPRPAGAGDPRRRPQEHRRDRRRPGRDVAARPRPQAEPGGDGRRQLYHLQPGRHRRLPLLADHQLTRRWRSWACRAPRPSRCGGTGSSCRACACRCP